MLSKDENIILLNITLDNSPVIMESHVHYTNETGANFKARQLRIESRDLPSLQNYHWFRAFIIIE